MIQRILLDLDDVCNSFTMSVLRRLGCPVGDYDYHLHPGPRVGYDIVAAYHLLKPADRPTLTKSEFWDGITRDIWATIPQSEEFNLLLGYCENLVGQENVCILTAPTIDPECLAGKLEFIHGHFPKWMHRQFLIGPRKHFCAHPEALLIDDSDKNVDQFREWGGNAILVPRPWNSLHARSTVAHLHHEFQHYFSLRESYV